jgi:hypothetical protein
MSAAPISRAELLKAEERQVAAIDAAIQSAWGRLARETAQSSLLAAEAAATAEAARQLALLGQTLAEDSVEIEGCHFNLEGETVRIDYRRPGGGRYLAAASDWMDLLVLRARVDTSTGTTLLQGFVRP